METFADIIGSWETVQAFAADIGVSPSLAGVWKFRDKIPDRFWKRVVEAAQMRGKTDITLELMADLAALKGLAA